MSSTLLTVALTTVLGAGPYGYGGPEYNSGGYGDMGYATPSDQMYPYDSPEPWLRGYIQHMPSYGGFRSFRPYNYRHVLAQAQTAGGWGMPVNMPYSQQFWHRYQKQAAMREQPQQPSTNMEQQLSQIRAYAYAAEMARLAALQNQQLQQPQFAPASVAPSRYLSTGYQSVAPSSAYSNARSQFGATGYPQMLTPPPRPLQSTNRGQAGFANPNGYPNNGYPMPATNRMPPRTGNWNSGVQPFTAGSPSAYAQPRSLPSFSQPPVDPAANQRMQRLNQISQQIQQQQQHIQALQGALQQELQQNYQGIR